MRKSCFRDPVRNHIFLYRSANMCLCIHLSNIYIVFYLHFFSLLRALFYTFAKELSVNLNVKMNVNIYLDKKPDANAKCQLFFHITGNGSKSKVSSNIKVSPENWVNGSINKREPNYDLNNAILQTKFGMLNRIIAEAELKMMKSSPVEVKEAYLRKLKYKEQEKTILDKNGLVAYFDFYKEQYKNIHKANTIRGLKQVRDHIEKFDPTISMEDVNQTWLVGYCNYLIELKLEDSTIKDRHIKAIKSVCNEGRRNKVIISDQVDKFKWKAIPKQPFSATWEEVLAIQGITDFITPIQGLVRDLFLFSCYTGLRHSDLEEINPKNIIKQGDQLMLRVVVTKTDFDYSIPLNQVIVDLLTKYKYKIPLLTQQVYNHEVKHVSRMKVKGTVTKIKSSGNKREVIEVDRSQMFTTHTGRRTFGRRFIDRGGSLIILSKIFGHRNTETTLNYIGYQPQEVISEFQKVFM